MKKRINIGVANLAQAVLMDEILDMMEISKSAKPYYIIETGRYYELSDDGKSETKLSEKEFMTSFKKLVKGKSEEEKEKLIDNMLKSCERSNIPKSIEALYEEKEVNNLTDLAHKIGFDQETISAEGLDITDVPIAYVIAITGGAPYYRVEPYNTFYQLFVEYEITPLNENVTGERNQFGVLENGEYKFKVTTNIGEEIQVTIPINEITIPTGTEYKVINKNGTNLAALSNLEDGRYSTFDTAFAIDFDYKDYDISNKIITWDGLSEEDDVKTFLGSNDNIPFSYVNSSSLPTHDAYLLWIIKDGKKYFGILKFAIEQ